MVDLLETNHFEEVAVEIGRGSIYRTAPKDTRYLLDDAYQTEARMGTSIGQSGNTNSAGTFGCYVRLRTSNGKWQTFGLTCHHVVLPPSSNHPSQDRWNKQGIMPGEKGNELRMDMPSLLDHLTTMKSFQESLQELETEEHQILRTRVQDPEDFVPPYQRIAFQRDEKLLNSLRTRIRRAEERFENGSERLASVYASSGLRLASSPSGSLVSVDWALLEIASTRSSYNYVSFFFPEFMVGFLN